MNTFWRWPSLTTTFSATFPPWQFGSWLISILAGLGAMPSNFTVPLTAAAVAGSIGVAAGGGGRLGGGGCSSAVSFLPPPAHRTRPNKVAMATNVLVFMLLLHLS